MVPTGDQEAGLDRLGLVGLAIVALALPGLARATRPTMDVEQALARKPVLSVVLDTDGRMERFTAELGLCEGEVDRLWAIATRERLFDRDLHQEGPEVWDWNDRVAEMAALSESDLREVMGSRYTAFLNLLQEMFDADANRLQPPPQGPEGSRTCLQYNVFGTQYVANTSYEVAVPDQYVKFTNLGWGTYSGYTDTNAEVFLELNGISNTVWVGDVGPWNIDDNYWNSTGGDRPRRMFTDLAQGYPEAEAAYYDGYNGGLDQYGRTVTNAAALDQSLDVATAMGLAYLQNAWIDTTYLWECTEDPDLDGDGYTEADGDCDDNHADVYPGAPEAADHVDNDCDGLVDEGTDYYDDDGDGYTEADGDCDDTNIHVHPGATEIENGIDDDCDGHVDSAPGDDDDHVGDDDDHVGDDDDIVGDDDDVDDYVDQDGDGYSPAQGDCDDTNPYIHPGAREVNNGVDDNCDGVADGDLGAASNEGFGCACDASARTSALPWALLAVMFWVARGSRRTR